MRMKFKDDGMRLSGYGIEWINAAIPVGAFSVPSKPWCECSQLWADSRLSWMKYGAWRNMACTSCYLKIQIIIYANTVSTYLSNLILLSCEPKRFLNSTINVQHAFSSASGPLWLGFCKNKRSTLVKRNLRAFLLPYFLCSWSVKIFFCIKNRRVESQDENCPMGIPLLSPIWSFFYMVKGTI